MFLCCQARIILVSELFVADLWNDIGRILLREADKPREAWLHGSDAQPYT